MPELVCPQCGGTYPEGKELCDNCRYIFSSAPILPQGAIIRNKYEIQNLLHSGGMGYIYLVKDKNLFDRLCVLKQVRERVQSEDHLKKLEEEALRMSRLNHPGVTMIFDHFKESGFYFLVEEYISGKTLSEVFRERKGYLNEDEVVGWAISICDIISYIHREGIIHRDISPDNIMLNDDGNIRFIDFGTLRELRYINAGHTAGMGKYGYTPPEQWQGKPEERSDIFALGATIYYLLTGFLPLSNSYISGQLPQKEDFYPRFPPIRTHNPRITTDLESVLEKALQLDVHSRFTTALDMQKALGGRVEEKSKSTLYFPTTRIISDHERLPQSTESTIIWPTILSSMQHTAVLLPLAVALLIAIYYFLLSTIFGGGWWMILIMVIFGIVAILSFFYVYRKEYSVKAKLLLVSQERR